jgi:hypothetical protein
MDNGYDRRYIYTIDRYISCFHAGFLVQNSLQFFRLKVNSDSELCWKVGVWSGYGFMVIIITIICRFKCMMCDCEPGLEELEVSSHPD